MKFLYMNLFFSMKGGIPIKFYRKNIFKKVLVIGLSLSLVSTTIPSSLLNSIQNLNVNAITPNPPDTIQLGGGLGFSVILKEDGTVWTFGRNDRGQLGLNDTIDRSSPSRIDPNYFNNEKIIRIEVSAMKAVALSDSNNIYLWGEGNTRPVKIYTSPSQIVDIDTGGYTDTNTHSSQHIVLSDGRVVSSGSNYQAQFGIGIGGYGSIGNCTTSYSTGSFSYFALINATYQPCPDNNSLKEVVPGSEEVLSDIVDISVDTNKRYLLGLDIYNTLFIWGEGKRNFATPLPNSSNLIISKIEAGQYPSILTNTGELYYYPSITGDPVKISLESSTEKVIDIKSGDNNLLVLGESGKLYALGPNEFGQIGSVISSSGVNWNNKIAEYTGIDNVVRIGVGVGHSIIQKTDNIFYTLGRNSYGQLSTTDVNSKYTFTKNTLLTNVKDIAASQYSSFAATTDNKFYVWGGRNSNERLNRPGPFNSPEIAKDFSTISNILELHGSPSSFTHGNILLENGTDWNFGHPSYWGLGDSSGSWGPIELKNTNSSLTTSTFLKSASQGYFVGIGLSDDNHIYTWGFDQYAMLGLGYRVKRISTGREVDGYLTAFQEPVVPSTEIYSKVYAGLDAKYILTEDGKVYAWGYNNSNRLGLSYSPEVATLVNTLPPIKEIAIGRYHTLFLDFNGDVWAAGQNSYGQLGLGNTSVPSIPTRIPALSDIVRISASEYSSYAISSTGQAYSFGDNRNGQLGLGDIIQRNEPRLIEGFSNVKEIVGGLKHSMLITTTGDLYVTGSDSEGQLGLAQSQVNSSPTTVIFPPNVSIFNADNQIYTVDDTLDVSGEIYTETLGVPIDVSYSLNSASGTTTTFLKTYTTSSVPEPFAFSIPLSGYNLGSYTLTVKAVTDTGVVGQGFINFAIQDVTKPTISVDIPSIPKWSTFPAAINVTADDTGGSGYRGFRYSISNTTSLPISWSPIIPNKSDNVTINNNGLSYLHLEAYDNIGNVIYLRTGPYYLDLVAPDFVFSEPLKWQHDSLNLGVDVQDVSNITMKKWLQGTTTMDEVKTTGNNLSSTSLPISMNGIYSFYAIDENNQESFETYNVTNINYTPYLNTSPSNILIPFTSKASFNTQTNFTHDDDGDAVQMITDLGSLVFSSLNSVNTISSNLAYNWNNDFSSLTENTLYSGNVYLKDSRGGLSNKVLTQLEVYNPNVISKSKVNGVELSWTHSKISQNYRLLRDGEVVYTGSNNNFIDNTTPNTVHSYKLEVLVDGVYVEVFSLNKTSGYHLFETPGQINFPSVNISNNNTLSPNIMDIEYVKYEDLSESITPYSLKVSMTEFNSPQSSFTANSFILKNIKKLDRSNSVLKTFSDVYVTSTPVELVSSDETLTDSYTKLEILKEQISLSFPIDIKLNSGSSESFNATLTWDISYTP